MYLDNFAAVVWNLSGKFVSFSARVYEECVWNLGVSERDRRYHQNVDIWAFDMHQDISA